MKAGIGITTMNRAKLLEITLSYISANWPDFDTKLVVSDDSTEEDVVAQNRLLAVKYGAEYLNDGKRKGIANNKNSSLYPLRECDYIVLLDDDCFPIKKGWFEFLINAHKQTGIHHFNLLDSKVHNEERRSVVGDFTVIECRDSGGVMLFLTKDVVERVGAFNKEYGLYGFEHCSYSKRIERSGLQNGYSANSTLDGLYDYLFSFDYANFEVNPCRKTVHKFYQEYKDIGGIGEFSSSMGQQEAKASVASNSAIFQADLNGPVYREF